MPIRIGVVAMLFIALLPLPYGYYTLLRIVVTIAFAWEAVALSRVNRAGLAVLFGFVALLFNPVIPVHLSRGVWAPIDVVAALLLAWSGVTQFRMKAPKRDEMQ